MAIYSLKGTELTTAFAKDGTELSEAFDVRGNVIFDGSQLEYGIENLPSYFQSRALTVANEINALSNDWQSFTFVTDPHQANAWNSQKIVMYLLANTPIRRAFFGGDYIEGAWSETEYRNFFQTFITNGFTSMIYPTIGNHELYLYNGATYDDLGIIYDELLADKRISGNPQNFYYYLDDYNKKVRYMVINTCDHSDNDVKTEQMAWINKTVFLPSSDWSLVAMGHIDIDATNITGKWKSSKSSMLTEALSMCNGHVIGYFCGHEHIDQLRFVNNKFHQLICLCDRFENSNYFNVDNYPTRTRGTDTEQVVTVVSFNTKTGQVVTRRIGAGDSYTWNYLNPTTA